MRKIVFSIQKVNFVEIQSGRFQWYSFVFERVVWFCIFMHMFDKFSFSPFLPFLPWEKVFLKVILSNVQTDFNWSNFTFGKFRVNWAIIDQIWLPIGSRSRVIKLPCFTLWPILWENWFFISCPCCAYVSSLMRSSFADTFIPLKRTIYLIFWNFAWLLIDLL